MPDSNVDPLVKEIIGIFQESHTSLGLDNLSLSIIGNLYFEPGEISMEELAQKTGYSLTSISQKLKFLAPFAIIRRRTRPGSRKVYLYMEKDLFKMWKQQIMMYYVPEIKIARENIPSLIEKYEKQATDREQKERLKILENYYKQILQFEKILNNLLGAIEELQE